MISFEGKEINGAKKRNPLIAPLLAQHEHLAGAVIIAAALHTQRAHANLIVDIGAHFVFTAKRNQKHVRQHAEEHFRARHTPQFATTEYLHGRHTTRSITVLPARAGFPFPHVKQIAGITRDHYYHDETNNTRETVFVMTSLGTADVTPHELADMVRKHWGIENGVNWVRDVTFGEDHSQIRTGNAPHAMATLRNLTINLLRTATTTTNLAQARRSNRHHPEQAYKLLNP